MSTFSDAQIVHDLVIVRFLTLFGAPVTDNLDAFYGEYERGLVGFAPDLLQAACDRAIDVQSFKLWPTIGSIKEALKALMEERHAEAMRNRKPDAERPRVEPDAASKARVDAMLKDCIAKLKISGPPPPKLAPLPSVNRDAWEARYGRQPQQEAVTPRLPPEERRG